MTTMVHTLRTAIDKALTHVGCADLAYVIDYPDDVTHGDYAVNAALVGAKQAGIKPQELARRIVDALGTIDGIEKIEIAGPGFINFFMSRDVFADGVRNINDTWGANTILRGKKILIEKSAPNLFKPFHVGHLLNISIGESLSRLTRSSGAEAIDVAYPSDISLGVAKAVWAILKQGLQDHLTVNTLGECYVYGTKLYDEDEQAKKEIIEINRKLNAQEQGVEWDIYVQGKKINLQYFKDITARLKSEFADYFFESDSGRVGKEIVESHVGTVFEKSDGAIIFRGEQYGLHTRVFITSLGLPVYESKDIGLLQLKFDTYHPDVSLVITDIEQRQYFEVIKQAALLVHKEWGERSVYWQHGRLRFVGGKISSRYGNVPLAEDLIDKVKEVVREKMTNAQRQKEPISDAMVENIALAALKYAFLKSGSGKNIIFDFAASLSLEGDSGPYLLYSYVRALSILEKAKALGRPARGEETTPEAPLFERLLPRFPEIVERAAREYEPHYIVTYLTKLAGAFNSWYAHERVIDADQEAYKLALTEAFAVTMKRGLWLLGIETVERM